MAGQIVAVHANLITVVHSTQDANSRFVLSLAPLESP